jgi:predicted PurR-regulated permease PerM
MATMIRRYFVDLTVLDVFNAVVVVVGALILEVPLIGTIAVITLLGSYLPRVSPLVLLITAPLGATLAGVAGVALAAPVTAVAVHSTRTLRESRPASGYRWPRHLRYRPASVSPDGHPV